MIMTMTAMIKKKDKMMINLVDFLPALEVLGPNESVVVEQGLGDNGVGRVDHRVVNRGQALPVSVVRAAHRENVKTMRGGEQEENRKVKMRIAPGSKFQHRPHRLDVVCCNGSVHRRCSVLRPVVEDGPPVHQGHHHPRRTVPDARDQRERSLARLGAVEVGIETLVAHFPHFLHIVGEHVVEKLLQVRPGVDVLQLLLVQVEHLVDASFELELEI